MKIAECNKIIFSSSCSVYGNDVKIPVKEISDLRGNNPYSISKIMCEEILTHSAKSDKSLKFIL